MTSCQECGYSWHIPIEDAVEIIAKLPQDLAFTLAGGVTDDDPRLRARPKPGVWSPLEYLAHTGDALSWYAQRIHRLLNEHRPTLIGFDWGVHTQQARYGDRHLTDVLAEIAHSCTNFAAMMAPLTDSDLARAGTGSDGRPRSVAQLVVRAAHEARHHTRDIRVGLYG